MQTIGDLKPDPKNARTHNPRNIGMIADALNEVGAARSIVIDEDNMILAGNGVVAAAAIAGIENVQVIDADGETIVAVRRSGLTEEQKARLALFDNRTAELADWDTEVLARLKSDELLDGLWGEQELAELLADFAPEPPEDPGAQIDKAAELQEKWQVERGQVWEVGPHRVMCGDSTSAEDVGRLVLLPLELVFSSPPYSDQREYGGNILNIENLAQIFHTFKTPFFAINLGIQFKNGRIYPYWDDWLRVAEEAGLGLLSWNVWDKVNASGVSAQIQMFALQHEWLFVFGREARELHRTWQKSEESKKRVLYYRISDNGQKVTTRRQPDGTVKESSVGRVFDNKQVGSVITVYAEMSRKITSHPALFPVDLPMAYIEAMTEENQCVADPFLGSGTTIVACEQTGRVGYGMEISPGYVGVTLERLAGLGLEPRLVDG